MTVTAETTNSGTYRVATPAELERVVQRMSTKNPYVVVTRDDRAGFAQAHLGDDKTDVRVEYRGGPRSLLHRAHLPREQAGLVLTGWAFDRPGWRRGISWESESLERYVDIKSHLEFTQTATGVSCRLAGEAPAGLEWMWEIVASGEDEHAAYAEWVTEDAVLGNGRLRESGVAHATLLGSWVVEGRRPGLRLSPEQEARINASSSMSWAGTRKD